VGRDRNVGQTGYVVLVVASLAVLVLCYLLFQAALAVARRNRESEGAAY